MLQLLPQRQRVIQIVNLKLISAASITQTTANVFVTEQHVISCDLSDIPQKMTGVTWSPATETANEYNLADGSFSSNSQTSTLTITASKLLALDGQSNGIHTFTCSFTVGTQSTAVTATQTITIFNPSNAIVLMRKYHMTRNDFTNRYNQKKIIKNIEQTVMIKC